MTNSAVEVLKKLRGAFKSTNLNWEGLLYRQYTSIVHHPRTIVDIGAHKGVHTVNFLTMNPKRVVAFEPIPDLAARLRTQFSDPRLEIQQVALSNESGRAIFSVDQITLGESGLVPRQDKDVRNMVSIEVELRTLDSFAFRDVDFIKIDTEGAEMRTLGGATATINSSRPVLAVEYGSLAYSSYGVKKTDLLDFAQKNSYMVHDLFGNEIDSNSFDQCVDVYYWDYLLIPAERGDISANSKREGSILLGDIRSFHHPSA